MTHGYEVDRLKRLTRPIYDRAQTLAMLGIWYGPTAPVPTITYAEWLAGDAGYWGWIDSEYPNTLPANEQGTADEPWDDVLVGATQGTGAASLATVAYRGSANVKMVALAPNDILTITTQFPHGWNLGNVRPHIHWVPNATPAALRNIRLTVKHAWALYGEDVPTEANWHDISPVDIPVPVAAAFKSQISSLGTVVPPAGVLGSSILLTLIKREAAGDTYNDGAAANMALLSLDTHFQRRCMGTVAEIPT